MKKRNHDLNSENPVWDAGSQAAPSPLHISHPTHDLSKEGLGVPFTALFLVEGSLPEGCHACQQQARSLSMSHMKSQRKCRFFRSAKVTKICKPLMSSVIFSSVIFLALISKPSLNLQLAKRKIAFFRQVQKTV